MNYEESFNPDLVIHTHLTIRGARSKTCCSLSISSAGPRRGDSLVPERRPRC